MMLDLSPGDDVAVLLNVKLERACELPADGVEPGPGQRNADAHLEDVVGGCAAGAQADGGAGRQSLEQCSTQHHRSPRRFLFSSYADPASTDRFRPVRDAEFAGVRLPPCR